LFQRDTQSTMKVSICMKIGVTENEIYIGVFRYLSSAILVLLSENGQLYLSQVGIYLDLPPIKTCGLTHFTSKLAIRPAHSVIYNLLPCPKRKRWILSTSCLISSILFPLLLCMNSNFTIYYPKNFQLDSKITTHLLSANVTSSTLPCDFIVYTGQVYIYCTGFMG
jgi:hypothetical protein